MNTIECPACEEGLKTTSNTPNIKHHLKKRAGAELLRRFLLGDTVLTPHADYIKTHMKVERRDSIDILM